MRYITGSVDKCSVLDQSFRNIKNTSRSEQYRVRQLFNKAYGIRSDQYFIPPPIQVYLLGHDYYVMDGHRRVACAKALQIEYLDAHVIECVALDAPESVRENVVQREFDRQTGLQHLILLTHTPGYHTLLQDISEYCTGKEFSEKAQAWFSHRFLFCIDAIRLSPLPDMYPDLLAEDIYVLLADFYRDLLGGLPSNTNPKTLISGYLFARKIPEKRLYRQRSSRVMLSIFKHLMLRHKKSG